MKPIDIKKALDLAKVEQFKGNNFVPLFAGDAGIGKSEICQQWAKDQGEDFHFLDIRIAYNEPQDFNGLPVEYTDKNGVLKMKFATPDMWPTDPEWRGLILFEEPNRGMLATMNGMMQVLTDRRINNIVLPKGAVLAAAINPEGKGYDVNSMDAALKNRFVMFDVRYDDKGFIKHMQERQYNEVVIGFVSSDFWNFKPLTQITDEEVYISPRSISKLNMLQNAMDAHIISVEVYNEGLSSILGSVSKDYMNFVANNKPITVNDIIADKKGSLAKLKKLSEDKFRTDSVRLTLDSVKLGLIENKIKDELFFEVLAAVKSEDLVLETVKATWLEKHCLNVNSSDNVTLDHNALQTWLDSSKEAKAVKKIMLSAKMNEHAQVYIDNLAKT